MSWDKVAYVVKDKIWRGGINRLYFNRLYFLRKNKSGMDSLNRMDSYNQEWTDIIMILNTKQITWEIHGNIYRLEK